MPLTIPLKQSSDVDLSTRVASFLKNNFSELGAETSNQMASEFDKLRRTACVKALDRTETSLAVLTKYHDQLVKIQGKIPFSMKDCAVTFAWKDPFEKKGAFSSSKGKIAMCSGDFEHLCVLWNCAALMSQIAASQMEDDEGAKEAVKNFNRAAGIYNYIKDNVAGVLNKETPTTDLLPTTLTTLSVYMLACAQEQIYQKASRGGMKENVLAKLCEQAYNLYKESNRHSQQISKDLVSYSSTKSKYFKARAQWHQAKAHQNDKLFGEMISRLRVAEGIVKDLSKESQKYKTFYNDVKNLREEAEKENNFIYHCVIPAPEKLEPIGVAAVAKATTYKRGDLLTPADKAVDFFEAVQPIEVNEANSTFETKKKAFVDGQIERIRDLTTTLNGVLRTMHLPEAIEETSGSGVPRSVADKALDVRVKGGIDKIKSLSNNIPDSLQRNHDLLNEAKRMLTAEQESDSSLRAQFGTRLVVSPSDQLTKSLWTDCQKYEGILQKAVEADSIVKQKIEDNARGLELLSGTDDQLNEAFPSGSVANVLSDNPVIKELKTLCQQSEALKNERDVIESEMRGATVTMNIEFCQALQEQGVINAEEMSQDKLENAFAELVSQINDSADRQESVLANLQRCSQEFSMLKKSGAAEEERQKVLSQINTAYDSFRELCSNLEEGTKFYNDLTNYLLRLQGKVSDFCFARKTEKDEFLRTQTNIASEAGNIATPSFLNQAQPPPSPAPQQENSGPPARPPPPTFQQGPPQPGGVAQHQQPSGAPVPAPRNQPPQGPPQGGYQPQGPPPAYAPQYQPHGQNQYQPPHNPHQAPYAPNPSGAPAAPYPQQNYWNQQQQPAYGNPPQQGQNPGYPSYPPQGNQYQPYPNQPGYGNQPGQPNPGYPQGGYQPPYPPR